LLTQELDCEEINPSQEFTSLEKKGTAKFNQLRSNDDLIEIFEHKPSTEMLIEEKYEPLR